MNQFSLVLFQTSKFSLYLAIFLLPLFFLPLAQNLLDYPKQILFLFLVFLSLICWLVTQLLQGKVILKENKLLYFSLSLLFFLFSLSVIFSIWPTVSFWGWSLSVTDSFLTLFSFLLLVFLFVNIFQTEADVFTALTLLLISGTIAGIFLLLQLYSVFVLPFDFSRLSLFNTLGSIYQAAIFLTILLPISLTLAFQIRKPIFWIILSLLFVSVLLIDLRVVWIILLIEVLILAFFSLSGLQTKIRGSWIACLMVILIFSLFFIFFPLRFVGFPVLPLQVFPSIISEIEILRDVYSQGLKNIFLGTGPGTFIFDYSKYRSPDLNQTIFWGIRFSSGSSEFLDWFITKGFLGGIFLLFFLGLIIFLGIKGLDKNKNSLSMKLGFLSSAVGLLGAGFFSSFNFSLWFIFWIVVGGLFFYNSKIKEIEIKSRMRRTIFPVIILVAIIISLTLFFLQSQKYLAEINHAEGIKLFGQGDIDRAINSIQKATLLNSSLDIYWRDLAQLYLTKANLITQDQGLETEEKKQLVHQNISRGIESLNQAIAISPFNVANWNVRGFLYRSLIGIPEAGELALESYRRAIELEPASPFPYGEIGRTYILMAQDFRGKQMVDKEKESLSLAIENLENALKLKPDYAQAHYLIAVAYDQQGREEEAIARLEEIKETNLQDVGIFFQLGMLYWRKEKLDEAQREFEEVIKLNPDYSNARYMLGLVYDKKGDKEKAKEQFAKTAQLNPENEEVKKILENLKQGLPALEGIISSQPPILEMPPEIQK